MAGNLCGRCEERAAQLCNLAMEYVPARSANERIRIEVFILASSEPLDVRMRALELAREVLRHCAELDRESERPS